MSLTTITPPATPLLVPADLKQMLRLLPEETEQDELIQSLIAAAVIHCESFTRRRLLTQSVRLTVDTFLGWNCDHIFLPIDPIQSITAVTYRASGGNEVVLEPERYRILTAQSPSLLAPAYGQSWPLTQDNDSAVWIDMTVGYGDDKSAVPEPILHAVRLLVADWFQNREPGENGGGKSAALSAANVMLTPYVVWL